MRCADVAKAGSLGILLLLLAAAPALAQVRPVRVVVPESAVYQEAETGSPVLATVKAGTLLETIGRKADFFVVLLPADSSGLRRMGYVPAAAVARVDELGEEPGRGLPVAAAGPAVAPAAVPRSHSFELSGFGGVNRNLGGLNEAFASGLQVAGIENIRIQNRLSTQVSAGMTFGAVLGRYVVAFSEFSYSRAADASFDGYLWDYPYGYQEVSASMRTDLYEVSGGAHVNIPISRVVPYVGGGAGAAWLRVSASTSDADAPVNVATTTSHRMLFLAAGARVFITKRFGVRPEYRAIYLPDTHFYRVGLSVFGRF